MIATDISMPDSFAILLSLIMFYLGYAGIVRKKIEFNMDFHTQRIEGIAAQAAGIVYLLFGFLMLFAAFAARNWGHATFIIN